MKTVDIDLITSGDARIRGILLRSGGWIKYPFAVRPHGGTVYAIHETDDRETRRIVTYVEAEHILGITIEKDRPHEPE